MLNPKVGLRPTSNQSKTNQPPVKLWLTVEEAAPYLGSTPDVIWREIRQDKFPFEYVRSGRKIKISARSIGLIEDRLQGIGKSATATAA